MKLKDQLILRKVAGQYVIVPAGKRVQEVPSTVYLSKSAAFLWDCMKSGEFTNEELVAHLLEHYAGITEERAAQDIDLFLKVLADNGILEGGELRKRMSFSNAKSLLEKLWPPGEKEGGGP